MNQLSPLTLGQGRSTGQEAMLATVLQYMDDNASICQQCEECQCYIGCPPKPEPRRIVYADVMLEAIELQKHNTSREYVQIITDTMLLKYPEVSSHIESHLRLVLLNNVPQKPTKVSFYKQPDCTGCEHLLQNGGCSIGDCS